jgi:hypothetical protein
MTAITVTIRMLAISCVRVLIGRVTRMMIITLASAHMNAEIAVRITGYLWDR